MGRTLLIVEDHPPVRSLLRELLLRMFPEDRVVDVPSGEQALAWAAREVPDLVVMDVGLNGVDGIETVRRLWALHQGVQVVVLTVHEEERYRREAAAAGAAAFVSKHAMHREFAQALLGLNGQGDIAGPVPPACAAGPGKS